MRKKDNKYVLRESELKEIIREMLLMEVAYDPNDYQHLYTKNYNGKVPNIGEIGKGALNLVTGIPGAVIPDKWKEAVANGHGLGNDALQWLLGSLGATAAGTAGPDFWQNIRDSKWLGGPGMGTPQNGDAQQVFNVARATSWIAHYASPVYHRGLVNCAKRVRMALNRGGLDAPWGMHAAAQTAKGYLVILPANGWDEIPAAQAGQPGDIIVLDAFRNHPAGHIAMCIGGGTWCAEYIHKTPWGTKETPPAGVVHYFRYRNRA